MDSEKETHSFFAVYHCENVHEVGGAIMLFRSRNESDAENPGSFWKLEQFTQEHDLLNATDRRMDTVGRITKVLINENTYTKVMTPWSTARLMLHSIYERTYINYMQESVEVTEPYELPVTKSRDLVAIAFVLRYSEEELADAQLRLNISVDGNELPGTSHAGIKINLRTGNHVLTEEVDGQTEKDLGGMAVLTKNQAQIQIREIDADFTKYILWKFGNGRLKELCYYDEYSASTFCNLMGITKPFKSCFCCCMLT